MKYLFDYGEAFLCFAPVPDYGICCGRAGVEQSPFTLGQEDRQR